LGSSDKRKLSARGSESASESWGALLEKAQKGGHEAFYDFVKASEKRLLRYLTGRCSGNAHMALDCLQETYLDIWNGISTYDRSKSNKAWVYRIAARRAGRILKKESKRSQLEVSMQQLTGQDGDDSTFEPTFVNQTAEDPKDIIELDEDVEILYDEISRLDAKSRDVMFVRHFPPNPIREAARILHMPPGTVGGIEHRAKRRLRDALKHRFQDRPHNVGGLQ